MKVIPPSDVDLKSKDNRIKLAKPTINAVLDPDEMMNPGGQLSLDLGKN